MSLAILNLLAMPSWSINFFGPKKSWIALPQSLSCTITYFFSKHVQGNKMA